MSDVNLSLVDTTIALIDAWATVPQTCDYLAGADEVADLYAFRAGAADLDAGLAARAAQPWRAPADQVAAALHQALVPTGVTPAMDRSLAKLARPDTVVVVGGQQPGLLGGPLYTLYKAATVILEAERLEAAGHPAVPIFWSATEDDDFEEVRRAGVIGCDDTLQTLSLDSDHRDGESVGPMPVPDGLVDQVIAAAQVCLPETEFVAELLEAMRACYGGGKTLGAGFACWLTWLLGDRGLLVLDPMTPALRALAAPLLERVLDDPLGPTRLANEVGERLETLGYHVPTHRSAELCAFYLLRDGLRLRLHFHDGGFITDTGQTFTIGQVRRELAASPEQFSTSLLLRPVVQDYLLNTALFITGPGEIAYAAQVRPVAESLDVAPPLLVPRRAATLLVPRVLRVLERYELTVPDFWDSLDSLTARVSREVSGGETEQVFSFAQQAVEAELERLCGHATEIDASLQAAGEGLANRVRGEIGKYEAKVQKAVKRQNETLVRRLAMAHTSISPGSGLQERRLSVLNYLAKFGPGFAGALVDVLAQVPSDVHAVIQVGA